MQQAIDLSAINNNAIDAMKSLKDSGNFIWSSVRYYDANGLAVEKRTVLPGLQAPEDFPEFVAFATVNVEFNGRTHQQPLAVPVKCASIVEAFQLAPALLEKEATEYKQHFEKQVQEAHKKSIEEKEKARIRSKLLG